MKIKDEDKSTHHTLKRRKASDIMNTSHIDTFKKTQVSNSLSVFDKYNTMSLHTNNRSASHLIRTGNINLGPSSRLLKNNQPNVIKHFKNID